MARYNYNVNTAAKYIDVHKQFNGGLKTVDTDDALGAVYLRDGENISISEFGFIEKRYGTYENFAQSVSSDAVLQGYWEFKGFIVFAVNGQLYTSSAQTVPLFDIIDASVYQNNVIDGRFYADGVVSGIYSRVFSSLQGEPAIIQKEKLEYRYPLQTTLDTKYPFQTERDVNAINVNDVLYIFTGSYPIYVKEKNGELKFYWLPITVPTYDEIVVTGHNLLEEDYETLYSEKDLDFVPTSSYDASVGNATITGSNYLPKFPYVLDADGNKGAIDFQFDTLFPIGRTFIPWNKNTNNPYVQIILDSVEYRSTGTGSSDLDFIILEEESVSFVGIDNYSGEDESINLISTPVLNLSPFTSSEARAYRTIASRAFYEFEKEFVVSKDIFRKANSFTIELQKENENGFNEGFNLSVFQSASGNTVLQGTLNEIIEVEITPVGLDGVEKDVTYTPQVIHNTVGATEGTYTFETPAVSFIGVDYFKCKFYHRVTEESTTQPIAFEGPTEMESTPEIFNLTVLPLTVLETLEKKIVSSTSLPALEAKVENLISGNYDFKFTFKIDTYNYSNGNLRFAYSDVFSTIVDAITITEEPFQDFPGLEDVPVQATSVWSCNRVIEHFGKLMIWGSQEMPSSVFYSFPDRPTYFPQNFYLNFGNNSEAPVEAVTPYMNILVVQTADETWGVRGNSGILTSPAPYTPFTINSTVGAIAWKSVRPVRNHLFFLSKQGVIALKSLYAADEQYNIEFVDRNIRNIVPQDTGAVGIQFDNQYWLNFPNFGITLRWYIDKKAWVLDTFGGYRNLSGTHIDKVGGWYEFNGIHKWQIVNGLLEFITRVSFPNFGDTVNNAAFYKIGVDYSLPTDLGEVVNSKMETSFLNQNYPFHPKNYKEAKLDFTIQNEYNLSKDALAVYPYQEGDTEKEIDVNGTTLTISSVTVNKNHRYRLSFDAYEEKTWNLAGASIDIDGNVDIEESDDETYIQFLLPNDIDGPVDITFTLPNVTVVQETDEIDLRDVTYDNELDFLIQVVSEDNILNQDLYEGYDDPKIDLKISLKDRLGDWTFGQTDFGKKVTAVDTIKLSGRGYNSKIYFEDTSKSKWTLESIGITFKMKRARSR